MHVEIIAGKLDYPGYRLLDRVMIQMIMTITDGPTDRNAVVGYTDWDQVDRFAEQMARAPVVKDAPMFTPIQNNGDKGRKNDL